ncbi:hypothetical protein LCGC14_1586900 [marine sediment metagenome]|uniref:Uncharacterized protein n=1 Tax=marine sediment metagenome TaxID=412755 RepID=A0A0F9IFG6_9ZZZZ
MKVILLFDSDKLDNCYREYMLRDSFDEDLRSGKYGCIEFCHPDNGEVMLASVRDPSEKKLIKN